MQGWKRRWNIRWRIDVAVGRPQMAKAMRRRLADDRSAVAIKIEQGVAFGGNRQTIERYDLTRSLRIKVHILDLQYGFAVAIGIERAKPFYNPQRPALEFRVVQTIGLGDGETVGVTEGPIEPGGLGPVRGQRQHQAGRAGDQGREQGVEERAGCFDLARAGGERLAIAAEHPDLGAMIVGFDIELDE